MGGNHWWDWIPDSISIVLMLADIEQNIAKSLHHVALVIYHSWSSVILLLYLGRHPWMHAGSYSLLIPVVWNHFSKSSYCDLRASHLCTTSSMASEAEWNSLCKRSLTGSVESRGSKHSPSVSLTAKYSLWRDEIVSSHSSRVTWTDLLILLTPSLSLMTFRLTFCKDRTQCL